VGARRSPATQRQHLNSRCAILIDGAGPGAALDVRPYPVLYTRVVSCEAIYGRFSVDHSR
jgi:hypothetical protein